MSNNGQFNTANATEASREGNARKGAMSQRALLKHAIEVERFAYDLITRMRESLVSGTVLSREFAHNAVSATRAWDTAVERIRILRNKPLPGSQRPERNQSRASRRPGHSSLPSRAEVCPK